MSGWWLAASAAAPTALTNASAAAKSCSLTVVTQLVTYARPVEALLLEGRVDLCGDEHRLAHGCVMSSGRTAASNSSAVRKPESSAASRSVVPSLWAFLATSAALS